jgi:hypothetical protein
MTNKKVYSIPLYWQCWGVVNVEADNIEEAKKKALAGNMPYKSEYVDDSMEVDEDSPLLRYQA